MKELIYLIFVNNSCQNTLFYDNNSKNSERHIFTKIKEILSKDGTKQRLNSPSLDSVKREREIAYSSLLYLSHKLYGFIGDLNFEEGKPSFEGSEKTNKKAEDSTVTIPSFNISHSENLCLIGIAPGNCQLGVDIEKLMDPKKAERINQRFLEPHSTALDRAMDYSLIHRHNNSLISSDAIYSDSPESNRDGKSTWNYNLKILYFDPSSLSLTELSYSDPTSYPEPDGECCMSSLDAQSLVDYFEPSYEGSRGCSPSVTASSERSPDEQNTSEYLNSTYDGRAAFATFADDCCASSFNREKNSTLSQPYCIGAVPYRQYQKDTHGRIRDDIRLVSDFTDENTTSKKVTERWTVCESLLKLDGSGFGGLCDLERISENTSTVTLKLAFLGNIYSAALSLKSY